VVIWDLLQNRSQTNKFGLSLNSGGHGGKLWSVLENSRVLLDGSSEQPSAKRRQTSVFASYTQVLEICSTAHLCCKVPLSLARPLHGYHNYMYHVSKWADVKSKGFCRTIWHLVDQPFCIASTSVPFEQVFSYWRSLYAPLEDVTVTWCC